jgi:DNA polymerase-3 subunit delta
MFYLFHGPDEFSMREELARLRREGDYDFNTAIFPGSETDLGSICATCDTLPFLSERRLVVVDGLPRRRRAARVEDELGAVSAGAREDSRPAQDAGRKSGGRRARPRPAGPDLQAFAQGLADYVSRLPSTTVLVVLVDELLETSHPLVRATQSHGQAVAFVPPRGADLERWIQRRAQAQNVRLASDAARQLAGFVGADLRSMAGEVEKLATYVGAGGEIGAAEVRLLTPTTHQARVFDLTDALARRDYSRALALLHELLDAGESPLGIVALTAHQTRTLLQVKALAEQGMRPPQIAQTAGLAPFVADKSLALARQFTVAQLEDAHRALLSIDTALKLSKLTPEMALDLFVVEFGR